MTYEYWRKDFWNDPDLWDGLNPHTDMCWMNLKRRRDVIDVRPVAKTEPVPNPYANSLQSLQNGYQSQLMQAHLLGDLLGIRF